MEIILNIEELEALLGENIKSIRLQKNISRKTLCGAAGVSQSALRHLESGEGATVKTLIRVVRALNKEDWLRSIAPKIGINPLTMVRNKSVRQRASKRSASKKSNGKTTKA